MAKKLDDLRHLDEPTEGAQNLQDERREAQSFLKQLNRMVGDADYSYAMDTLEGIYETVEREQRVTEGQRTAVANIVDGAARHQDRQDQGGSRRYDGFRGRRW